MKKVLEFIIAFILLTNLPNIFAQFNTKSSITPQETREIAKEAYIFSYPLVMNYRTMYLQAIDQTSKSYSGGFGKWRHYDPATPDNKDVVTPNVDTPYSWAWVDLRTEPWVLTLPRVEKDRYYTSQWDDLWGFILDSPGSVNDGNNGADYLLVDASWDGEKPTGIKRIIRGESKFLGGLTRTEYLGGADLPHVRNIQSQYKLQPLSTFLGKTPPIKAPALTWPKWTDGDEKTEQFFTYVNFILPYTIPNDTDKKILSRMSKLGIIGGQSWNPKKMPAEIRAAMQQGIQDAIKLIDTSAHSAKNSIKFFSTRQSNKSDYINRAIGVYAGMFGNLPDQAFYIPWSIDSQGDYLNSEKNNYTIIFPKDSLPPVKYFWSITMYSLPDHFLVANPIHRYSIGSRSSLTKSTDGSITIYIQKKSPGGDKDSNWLPAPNGSFYVVLRTYGPANSILNGQWKLPSINKTN